MRILIINSSPDTSDMLEEFFLVQGWTTAVCPLRPLREGAMPGAGLMATYRPDAILLDVAIPYEANWLIVQQLRNDTDVTCPIVVTTTNEAAVQRLISVDERILEIIGKPYDLNQLHESVLAAVTGSDAPYGLPKTDRRVADRRVRERRARPHSSDDQTADDDSAG
jgi:DNA-binding response OmpR family regulator